MRTFSLKLKDVTRKWHLLDASEAPLGRVATTAAGLLLGKHKPGVTPHVDSGDFVVVINSDSLIATGNKSAGKIYHRHSGYPGGLRQKTLQQSVSQDSTQVIRHAVRGMLADNKLQKGRLLRLKIYPSAEHPHGPQSPERLSLVRRGK